MEALHPKAEGIGSHEVVFEGISLAVDVVTNASDDCGRDEFGEIFEFERQSKEIGGIAILFGELYSITDSVKKPSGHWSRSQSLEWMGSMRINMYAKIRWSQSTGQVGDSEGVARRENALGREA